MEFLYVLSICVEENYGEEEVGDAIRGRREVGDGVRGRREVDDVVRGDREIDDGEGDAGKLATG